MGKPTKEDVLSCIRKALEVSPDVINDHSSSQNIEKWDSLGHLSILVALDKQFEGKISGLSEMAGADSVSKILEELSKHSLLSIE